MIDVVMPQLGESVTEGTIASWRKAIGDPIAADEPLCDVSTDKVAFEVPSPGAGILSEILAEENHVVAVGSVIARISASGDAATAPAARSAAEPRPEEARPSDARPRPSPLARRLARENAVDLAALAGSGARGRVRGEDVRRAIAVSVPASPAEAARTEAPVPDGDTVVPFSAARRQIAAHMVQSVHTSPHGYIAFEVDYGAVEQARSAVRERFRAEQGFGLTYLPFVLHAVAKALRAFPNINSRIDGDALVLRRPINLGIAVDLDHQGLVVPVIRNADGLNVTGLARAVADLASRARGNRLTAADLTDGTFTVTNPGPAGTYVSVPIINQPQTAILATDGVARRPAVARLADGSEVMTIRSLGVVGLSMDHRAFDGAYAAAFLAAVRQRLELTDWSAELSDGGTHQARR
ncbi:dihydrolipoamide acetyltransferase family protein [Microbaculum marinum]|uniref:Dihydrolipoamide acetyltransferase component of pyruvate dehydrogenase complex n=1 Tax=Microbaculum marinum TaxID=1764581 RepID=A0AAW9RFW2_9HYPH